MMTETTLLGMDERAGKVSRRRFLAGSVTLLAAGLTAGPTAIQAACAAQGASLVPPSPAQQKQVGAEAARQVLQKYKQVTDGRLRHFQELGSRLVSALPAPDRNWDFTFHVLEDKTVNAFAVPGGNMFLFTGLYKVMSTDDALAAVTGHEMAHVYRQHWAKSYAAENRRDVAIDVGAVLSGHLLHGLILGDLASHALARSYSRHDEDEADAYGLTDLVAAGYNPQGMVQLFTSLEKVAGDGRDPLGGAWFSDHPLTPDRIHRTEVRIARYGDRKFPPMTPLNYGQLSS